MLQANVDFKPAASRCDFNRSAGGFDLKISKTANPNYISMESAVLQLDASGNTQNSCCKIICDPGTGVRHQTRQSSQSMRFT